MNVVCIIREKGGFIYGLTIGKWYEVIENTNGYYLIYDNNNVSWSYSKTWFKTKAEIRDEKLNELGL